MHGQTWILVECLNVCLIVHQLELVFVVLRDKRFSYVGRPKVSRRFCSTTKTFLELARMIQLEQPIISGKPCATNLLSCLLLEDDLEGLICCILPPRHIDIKSLAHQINKVVHADVRHAHDSLTRHLAHTVVSKIKNTVPRLDVSIKKHDSFDVVPNEYESLLAILSSDQLRICCLCPKRRVHVQNQCRSIVLVAPMNIEDALLNNLQ